MKLARRKNRTSYFGRLSLLKKLFWLYLVLLIIEGALRKWVVPGLSAPLLIIRDPVGILIIWEAFRTKKWPHRWSAALALISVLIVGIFTVQLVFGGNQLIAALFGLRSYLLPFPVLLIMGENLDAEDLRKMGRFTLWLVVPMTLLFVAQYASSPDSFLNKAAYQGGSQIQYEVGHARASGTFSFVTGAADFGVLSTAFIFYGLVKKGFVSTWVLWVCTVALIVSIPMIGSRGYVFTLAGLLGCVGLGAMMGLAQFGRTIRILLPLLIAVGLASQLPVFSDAMGSMTLRFQQGAEDEGGGTQQGVLVDRVIKPLVSPFEGLDFTSEWIGKGIGRGAVAINTFLGGETEFALGEGPIGRELQEMGAYSGSAYELFKLWLAIMVIGKALAAARNQEPLALLLIPLVVTSLMVSPEQPSEQGFMIMGLAFCIAAAKLRPPVVKQKPVYALENLRDQVLARRRMQRTGTAGRTLPRRQLRRPETTGSSENL